ncbi:hypothetical protein BXZ70DRAFT_368368 [Cristinia sonorae]|uniref:BTB domain-containing protein n=1 Tax=Cristinia sonorae TaxID=1940300 RepID=A0A8K0UIV9_9AGAR|nr:hypothetical protein BXZ70DRAFT_368368 [Cristinia sonorae]
MDPPQEGADAHWQPPTHPFHDADADVVLRSACGVEFAVHKIILCKASSVFSDMFSLPGQGKIGVEAIPIVDLTEEYKTLFLMLSYCYPTEEPALEDIGTIYRLLEVMRKYAMDGLQQRVARRLEPFATSEPVRVFVVASCFGFERLARAAAYQTLRLSIWPLAADVSAPELQNITAATFQDLLRYHRQCSEAAVEAMSELKWLQKTDWAWLNSDSRCGCPSASNTYQFYNRIYTPKRWWVDFLQDARDQVLLKPLGSMGPRPTFLKGGSLSQLRSCMHCRVAGISDLIEFAELVQERIEIVIKEVQLKWRG